MNKVFSCKIGKIFRIVIAFSFVFTCNVYSQEIMPKDSAMQQIISVPEKAANEGNIPTPGNITVNFKEVDISTVLHYFSEVSGVDIVPSPGVEANVTMRLRDKPWEVALDIVTRNYGFAYSREGNIIRVIPKGQLSTEEPITEVIPLNHIIREVEFSKGDNSEAITVEQKQESINQLLTAINSIIDIRKGENATFISSANAIVITAIPAKISSIKEMIGKIDVKTPQIMLDAKVIEITLTDDERFGVDWNAIISASGAKRPITFPFTTGGLLSVLPSEQSNFYPSTTSVGGSPSFPFIKNDDGIDPAAPGFDSALFSYGTLDFSTFSATLSLLQNRGDTEILSSPRITTLNNQKATIKIVEKIMLQKTIETTQTASLVTVEFEDEEDAREVGIKLTVIPHVNDNGEISVNLLPEVSTKGGASGTGFEELSVGSTGGNTTVALTFNSREANTIVRVRDGETIFIGGLIKKSIVKTDNRVPILGDIFGGIPVFGNLFRYEAENATRSEIVFFVTVHLVEDSKTSIEKSETQYFYDEYIDKEEIVERLILPSEKNEENKKNAPIIKKGKIDKKEKTIEIEIPLEASGDEKKKPFLDFRKNKGE